MDWQVGDLAMCLRQVDWVTVRNQQRSGPTRGGCYEVTKINTLGPVFPEEARRKYVALAFAEFPGCTYLSEYFTKIDPQAEDHFDNVKAPRREILPCDA